ncbi:outer membrane family protein [Helicobacter bizzozeronii]|uniref:outer membrane family protein n=1 Tax=Helicobacter bizzozeronii TaxID=56877 RepID=UPI000CEF142E|nr:outer membrane family protein [Helicobacter bizzozeronii]
MKSLSKQVLALAALTGGLEAFEYKLGGWAESFSKIGFNNSKIDESKNIYPTETFVTVVGQGRIDFSLLPKKLEGHSLKGSIGGTVGGVAYDGTKHLPGGTQIFNYIGYYNGFMGNRFLDPDISKNTRTYVFNEGWLGYTYKHIFGIKAGRYESEADYMSGYTQGFDTFVRFKDKHHATYKLSWFSSWGRAFAYGEWLYDYYSPRSAYTTPNGVQCTECPSGKQGKLVNYGIHALSFAYTRDFQKLGSAFSISHFYYFAPKTYNTIGVDLKYDTNPKFDGVGFRSQTRAVALFPIYYDRLVYTTNSQTGTINYGDFAYRYGTKMSKTGQSLLIRQRFDMNEFNFGGAFYKVWQNANSFIGTTGNPLGIDFWTNSVYDVGQSLSNVVGTDAVSGWIFGGGVHKKWLWGILMRWTSALKANEGSSAVNVGYKFTQALKAEVKLEYYGLIMHKGYLEGVWGNPVAYAKANGISNSVLYSRRYSDRSHLMVTITAQF